MVLNTTESTPRTIGVADCLTSADAAESLITYALGSCVAVVMYDPIAQVGGLLHFLLPDCSLDSTRGRSNPLVYADTGIPILLDRCLQIGARKSRLAVSVAGGANVIADGGFFDIGRRNALSCRKALWKAGLLLRAEALGGAVSRSVRIDIATGKVWIKEAGGASVELAPTRRSTAKDGHAQ